MNASMLQALADSLVAGDAERLADWNSMRVDYGSKIDKNLWDVPTTINKNHMGSEGKQAGRGALRYTIEWIMTQDATAEDNAIKILNNWGKVTKFTLDTSNQESHRLWGGIWFGYLACAADLLESNGSKWSAADRTKFRNTCKNVFLPVFNDNRPVDFNGNWDLACSWSTLAFAVYLDDRVLFDQAINHLKYGISNGAINYYLLPSGQTQETTRDQNHPLMGLYFLTMSCQIAWNQGIDLFEYNGRSVGRAFEYWCRYNHPSTLPDFNKLHVQNYPNPMSPGTTDVLNQLKINATQRNSTYLRTFELINYHYEKERGIPLPWVKRVISDKTVVGDNSCLFPRVFFRNLDTTPSRSLPIRANVTPDFPMLAEGLPIYAANCGMTNGIYEADAGHIFIVDTDVDSRGGHPVQTSAPTAIANTDDEKIYQSYYLADGGNYGKIEWKVHLDYTSASMKYRFRLHFAEPEKTAIGERLFDVKISYQGNNQTIKTDLDIFAAAGQNTAYIYEFEKTLSNNPVVTIIFESKTDFALINAIEVIPLYTNPTDPYSYWMEAWPQLTGTNDDKTADPDGDGIPNLMEYASYRDPSVKDADSLIQFSSNGSSAQLTFPNLAKNIKWSIESKNSLSGGSGWSSVAGASHITSTNTMPVQISGPSTSAQQQFFRINATNN